MNNSIEIKYNKEQASYGVEQLKQCQKELSEADELFYKGVMALGSAKGIDLIINEDSAINLYMPEKIVIECREGITNLIEEITTNISLIEGFNKEPKETTSEVQKKEITKEVTSEPKETVAEVQNKDLAQEVTTESETHTIKNNQLIYGPPPTTNGQAEINTIKSNPLLYGPPPRPDGTIEGQGGTNQLIYGPPPTQGTINCQGETNQLIYGPPPTQGTTGGQGETNQLIYGPPGITLQPDIGQENQLLYGPPPTPVDLTQEGTNQLIYGPPPTQDTGTTGTEYEPIPNTGIPNTTEKSYISKHPKLIGGLAATIGLFGLPTIISDDIDEEEELKYNKKKD